MARLTLIQLQANHLKILYPSPLLLLAVTKREYREIHLLCNYSKAEAGSYVKWLRAKTTAKVKLRLVGLSSPTEYGEIYEAATPVIDGVLAKLGRDTKLTFHLSPGTPAMVAVWILIGKTKYQAELIESSREKGLRTVHFPFDIAADFIPDSKLEELARYGITMEDAQTVIEFAIGGKNITQTVEGR